MTGFSQSRRQMAIGSRAGFSLTELLIVIAIMGIVTAIAVVQIASTRSGFKGDGAMRVVLAQMNQARELAITQRRNMRLVFTAPNAVAISREEMPWPNPLGPPTLTVLSSVHFEGG